MKNLQTFVWLGVKCIPPVIQTSVNFSIFNLHFLSWLNACTLVPTVFLRHDKTEFELPVSFFVYPRHRKTEFGIPFSYSIEIWWSLLSAIFLLRKDLFEVIKNRFPSLRGCSSLLILKRFCSCHGIKKWRLVADGTVHIRSMQKGHWELQTAAGPQTGVKCILRAKCLTVSIIESKP